MIRMRINKLKIERQQNLNHQRNIFNNKDISQFTTVKERYDEKRKIYESQYVTLFHAKHQFIHLKHIITGGVSPRLIK